MPGALRVPGAGLDSISALLPRPDLFLYSYVRKEALLSSQIEGTQSSLSDLLLFEVEAAPGVPFDDVVEVSNYVAALEAGLVRLRDGFPLSDRLIREIHALLIRRGRGADKQPGEFRRTQNWLGGTSPETAVFVPPPPLEVEPCMAALERFLHDDPERTSPVVKAGLADVQFETIHPFLDGNGRVGRLLVALTLHNEKVLTHPLLYLSDPATLLIVKSTRETEPGHVLVPEIIDLNMDFIPHPPSGNVEGVIMAVTDDPVVYGEFQVAVINRGSRDGLVAGNVLSIWDLTEEVKDETKYRESSKVTLPGQNIGRYIVFMTWERMSYGLVLDSRREMQIGYVVKNP